MTPPKSEVGQIISEVAHEEGDSKSAEMQSNLTKQRNFEDAAADIGSKLDAAPGSITTDDAQILQRRQARAFGGDQTAPESLIAQVQHEAAVNEGATSGGTANRQLDPQTQSQMGRQANFQDAAAKVGSKLVNEPSNVTKEEADLLHSREQRAFGITEKGGLASKAQHQVAENEKP
ncbi:MAG: hypothetical protein LQ342_004348 [Letrouitia transgressa]|nr:MAG: hypothetical protein LQ342_004348 [Letrouitia transgressa]